MESTLFINNFNLLLCYGQTNNVCYLRLQSLFNIPNEYAKRRVFESLLAARFRSFKCNLVRRFITKKLVRKPKNKKGGGSDDDVIDEEKLPWQIWPSISKDDWEAFVLQKCKKEEIVSLKNSDENCVVIYRLFY